MAPAPPHAVEACCAGKTLMSGKCRKPARTLLAEREWAHLLTKFEPGSWH
jgi:hypothetical protein